MTMTDYIKNNNKKDWIKDKARMMIDCNKIKIKNQVKKDWSKIKKLILLGILIEEKILEECQNPWIKINNIMLMMVIMEVMEVMTMVTQPLLMIMAIPILLLFTEFPPIHIVHVDMDI